MKKLKFITSVVTSTIYDLNNLLFKLNLELQYRGFVSVGLYDFFLKTIQAWLWNETSLNQGTYQSDNNSCTNNVLTYLNSGNMIYSSTNFGI